jgi:hypothetical protein
MGATLNSQQYWSDYSLLDDPIGAYLCAQRAYGLIVERTQQTDSQLAT